MTCLKAAFSPANHPCGGTLARRPLRWLEDEMMDAATISITGLSQTEAAARLRRDGPNALPGRQRRSIFAIAFSTLREPMFQLLLGAGALYLVLGNVEEALALLASARAQMPERNPRKTQLC